MKKRTDEALHDEMPDDPFVDGAADAYDDLVVSVGIEVLSLLTDGAKKVTVSRKKDGLIIEGR